MVGIAVQSQRGVPDGPAAVPAGAVDGTGFVVGSETAPVTVEVYEDFQCPACRAFEQTSGPVLDSLVDAGTARVIYRPIAFLDRASTTRYSTRALNAAACAADAGAFTSIHQRLWTVQPPEGTPGLSDEELIRLGADSGADGADYARCVRDLRYQPWTRQVTDEASKRGINATPTVLVNGQALQAPTPDTVRAAIENAAAPD